MGQFRLRLKRNIDNWMQSIDPIVLGSKETLDKAIGIRTYGKAISHGGVINTKEFDAYKNAAKQLRRISQLEKHRHMVNTKNLFTQFKALNTIPALVKEDIFINKDICRTTAASKRR
ncbi:hypothetical protein RFI_00246 [Reticulomyxa filosa]|uniref:Uncharacterized protein n=1 Tax=Reticulomyxa filosa TaxID=46433 RepID=X6PF41_RETFI|nr:hypothetical protein RFI_00246 [Reticulomyxa filosa]|eukprot:ETO36816.1 hypothetical protein RFI_00246 [Reticulomyxa filosa]